jgi:hypothetical protein
VHLGRGQQEHAHPRGPGQGRDHQGELVGHFNITCCNVLFFFFLFLLLFLPTFLLLACLQTRGEAEAFAINAKAQAEVCFKDFLSVATELNPHPFSRSGRGHGQEGRVVAGVQGFVRAFYINLFLLHMTVCFACLSDAARLELVLKALPSIAAGS